MRPRIPQLALVQCAMALVLMLLGTPAVEASMPRFLPPGPPPPPASMEIFMSRQRSSDTVDVEVVVYFNSPCTNWRGEWRIWPMDGLEPVAGALQESGTTADIIGTHFARLRCTRWGEFEIRGFFGTAVDSLNRTSHEYRVTFRASPDSFVYTRHMEVASASRQHVLGGIHHRSTGWVWLPLDPGESEQVEPGFDERNHKSPPPALQKASGVLPGAVSKDSSVTVMVRVAVDREGRVKDVYARRVAAFHPPEVIDAAVEAARHWTFTPAKSFGRPASALYSIGVPVALDRRGR